MASWTEMGVASNLGDLMLQPVTKTSSGGAKTSSWYLLALLSTTTGGTATVTTSSPSDLRCSLFTSSVVLLPLGKIPSESSSPGEKWEVLSSGTDVQVWVAPEPSFNSVVLLIGFELWLSKGWSFWASVFIVSKWSEQETQTWLRVGSIWFEKCEHNLVGESLFGPCEQ